MVGVRRMHSFLLKPGYKRKRDARSLLNMYLTSTDGVCDAEFNLQRDPFSAFQTRSLSRSHRDLSDAYSLSEGEECSDRVLTSIHLRRNI